jgi:hypothetical protein
MDAVAGVVGALAPRPAARFPALRRLLLVRVPDEVADARPLEIETGWIPGPVPRTWLRRVSGAEGARYFRGSEGDGSAPQEVGEGTFVALWPSTDGRRVAKLRRVLVDGGRRWSVDEYPELRLAMAEVDAPAGAELRPPRGLRHLVVREVTEERAYAEERLAARPRQTPGE